MKPFVSIDSEYGDLVINRHNAFQAEALIKTGRSHIHGEVEMMKRIIATCGSQTVVIDGGANAGLVTIPLALFTRDKGGLVLSFEPQKMMYYALGGSLALNLIENVELFRCALGAKVGSCYLPHIDYTRPRDFGMVQVSEDSGDHVVPVETIDHVLESGNHKRLDFLKLDVEGYEYPALLGGAKSLRDHKPWVWFEYFLHSPEALNTLLGSFPDGYRFFVMDRQNMLAAPVDRLRSSGLKITAKEFNV